MQSVAKRTVKLIAVTSAANEVARLTLAGSDGIGSVV
jgi:hypothetical protein